MLIKALLKQNKISLYNCMKMAFQSVAVDLDKCHQVITDLINKAGEIIRKRNDTRKDAVAKEYDIDLVTETDKEVEQLLMQGILKEFPDHKFIGEEESSSKGAPKLTTSPTWIIDPVDGTMNFVHAYPHSSISVGLVVDKITELAYVDNPMLGQSFYARRGQGAFYNDKQIKVSGETQLCKALVTSEYGTSRDPDKLKVVQENYAKLVPIVHGIRMLGSAALNMSMVGLGAADVYYEFGIHAWDVCAADLIVREAGGVVIDPAGGPFDLMSRRVLAAASPELAKELSQTLTQFYPQPRDD